MNSFWDERFGKTEYVYGTQPNRFFEESLIALPPGRLLLPGEGEGRNAVFAAAKGWKVDAFDSSKEGKRKAEALAQQLQTTISYSLSSYEKFEPDADAYDAVGLIFTHCDPKTRKLLHLQMVNALKPNGFLILEAFSKGQLGNESGGPRDLDMLFSLEELKEDFSELTFEHMEEAETILSEGSYHQGKASVVRLIARKTT